MAQARGAMARACRAGRQRGAIGGSNTDRGSMRRFGGASGRDHAPTQENGNAKSTKADFRSWVGACGRGRISTAPAPRTSSREAAYTSRVGRGRLHGRASPAALAQDATLPPTSPLFPLATYDGVGGPGQIMG